MASKRDLTLVNLEVSRIIGKRIADGLRSGGYPVNAHMVLQMSVAYPLLSVIEREMGQERTACALLSGAGVK